MKFIPIDKMKKLRESAKSGDERAKHILAMQLKGDEDFSELLEEYFAPAKPEIANAEAAEPVVEEHKDKLHEFLEQNGVKEGDEDYDEVVKMFYAETGGEKPAMVEPEEECVECICKDELDKLRKEELDAIDSYSKKITIIMSSDELNDNQKRKIVARLKEIRSDEEEHYRELGELLALCDHDDIDAE